ncbi:MAG: glycosyltransferase family 2 protein [Methylacidiphilales bacterium]|nr:glycosyltransferase family 2 protein [Candidatus Methylacidiphilales bacterium]
MILERRPAPRLLSLVIPCFNEEAVLPILRDRLSSFVKSFSIPVEIIFVDDGSRDNTLLFLMRWASENSAVKIIGLARNFGHQNAATAGLDAAKGDAVVLMDADLQDPLEVIQQMTEKYCEGYDVIYGQRISREGESWFKRITAWLFYRLMKVLVHSDLPLDAGDFRLISRRSLDALCSMHEVHRFLRGMITWVGFAQVPLKYRRDVRAAGSTKYTVWKMCRFAWNAIVSFSPLPLRISLVIGIIVACGGAIYGIYAVLRSLIYHDTVLGWTTQIVLTSVLGGTILVSNGLLGEYVGRIFEEIKGRPLYIVATRVNFS